MEWEDCLENSELIAALRLNQMKHPTDIQQASIAAATKHKQDLIIAAKTGSGKTLCFVLPILLDITIGQGLQALILSPTRELCLQIQSHITRLNFKRPNVVTLIGGLSSQKQERLLSRNPDILIATPGRLWDFVEAKKLNNLRKVKFLVIDEADRMIELGHFKELKHILHYLNSTEEAPSETGLVEVQRGNFVDLNYGCGLSLDPEHFAVAGEDLTEVFKKPAVREKSKAPPKRQTFLASATLTVSNEVRKNLYKRNKKQDETLLDGLMRTVKFRGKPKVIDLASNEQLPQKLSDFKVKCTDADKIALLHYVLAEHPGMKTMIFANAVATTKRLARALRHLNYSVSKLEGKMSQKERLAKLEQFIARNDVLVASDVACRGLDLPAVQLVVHYALPQNAETYIHRCGRTARANRSGTSIAFVSSGDIAQLRAIQRLLKRKLSSFPLDLGKFTQLKSVAQTALEVASLEMKNERAAKHNAWAAHSSADAGVDHETEEWTVNKAQLRKLRSSLQDQKQESATVPTKRTSVITPELYRLAKKQQLT